MKPKQATWGYTGVWEPASNHHYCSKPAAISFHFSTETIVSHNWGQAGECPAGEEPKEMLWNTEPHIYKHRRYLSAMTLVEGHTHAHRHTSGHSSAAEEPGKAASSLITALTSELGRHPQPRGGQTHWSYSLTPNTHAGRKDILLKSKNCTSDSKVFPSVVLRRKENKWECNCAIWERWALQMGREGSAVRTM